MKRIGRILFCLLPLLLTIALQNLISIPICGITAIATVLKSQGQGSFEEILYEVLSLWSTGPFVIAVSMAYAIVAMVIFGFWYHKKIAPSQERIPVANALNRWMALSLFLLSLGLQYVIGYLMNFVGMLRPDWMQAYTDLIHTAGIGTLSQLTLIYAIIIAPISEELAFRGVTFGYAKKAMPVAGAICLQAILFGVFHLNMIQGIYAAFLGLFIGYLCEAGGTVAIPMLFHAFFNLIGSLAGDFMYYRIEQPFFFLLWLTVGVLLTYAGIFLFQYSISVRDMSRIDA